MRGAGPPLVLSPVLGFIVVQCVTRVVGGLGALDKALFAAKIAGVGHKHQRGGTKMVGDDR